MEFIYVLMFCSLYFTLFNDKHFTSSFWYFGYHDAIHFHSRKLKCKKKEFFLKTLGFGLIYKDCHDWSCIEDVKEVRVTQEIKQMGKNVSYINSTNRL